VQFLRPPGSLRRPGTSINLNHTGVHILHAKILVIMTLTMSIVFCYSSQEQNNLPHRLNYPHLHHEQRYQLTGKAAREHTIWFIYELFCVGYSRSSAFMSDHWIHVDMLVEYINSKFRLEDELALEKATTMRVVNKVYSDMSSSGNKVVIDDNVTIYLFRHEYKSSSGQRQHFFHATQKQLAPLFPSSNNAAAWQSNFASDLLPPMTR
jgi:hypothetical protein